MSVTVHYNAQSLDTDSGARAVYRKLVKAAVEVCPQDDSAHFIRSAVRQCREESVARAVYKINNQRLAAVYAANAKKRMIAIGDQRPALRLNGANDCGRSRFPRSFDQSMAMDLDPAPAANGEPPTAVSAPVVGIDGIYRDVIGILVGNVSELACRIDDDTQWKGARADGRGHRQRTARWALWSSC